MLEEDIEIVESYFSPGDDYVLMTDEMIELFKQLEDGKKYRKKLFDELMKDL